MPRVCPAESRERSNESVTQEDKFTSFFCSQTSACWLHPNLQQPKSTDSSPLADSSPSADSSPLAAHFVISICVFVCYSHSTPNKMVKAAYNNS